MNNLPSILTEAFTKDGVCYAPGLSEFVDWVNVQANNVTQHLENGLEIEWSNVEILKLFRIIIDYNNSLKLPLQLEHLIPCLDGEPMEEPSRYGHYKAYGQFGSLSPSELNECQKYQKALDQCLFKGFEWDVEKKVAILEYKLKNGHTGDYSFDPKIPPPRIKGVTGFAIHGDRYFKEMLGL